MKYIALIEALDITVKGIVQGVGFRPFVYRLARKYVVNGWVLNSIEGVFIHAEAEAKLLDEFVWELSENPPAASKVEEISLQEVPLQDCQNFQIRFSNDSAPERTTLVSPDMATCDDCLRELFDPHDKRYRYPFINCTNCGPRFTIIDALPYDRPFTSMGEFTMCDYCNTQYCDPLDRRFHAQPNACYECGPRLSWCERKAPVSGASDASAAPERSSFSFSPRIWGDDRESGDAVFARAVECLREGNILAVKGLGGFHLVCDAFRPDALEKLRSRKHRDGKAFAVMVSSVEAARRFCKVNEEEAALLQSVARPIVLLKKRPDVSLARGLADKLPELGIMLPATPVQYLLLHDYEALAGKNSMLVMTSGNVHDEPIVIDDEAAQSELGFIADAIMGNNRAILTRFDDSVLRVLNLGEGRFAQQFIRRARGFAPLPLEVEDAFDGASAGGVGEASAGGADGVSPSGTDGAPIAGGTGDASKGDAGRPQKNEHVASPVIFAAGPQQKNTFCFLQGNRAFVSQHIGDMENAQTNDAWLMCKSRFEKLFHLKAQVLACDMHPQYLTSEWARRKARKAQFPLYEVQHHHAHIVSVLAENGLSGPVCGFAFDGTGYGPDGCVWGGEVLIADRCDFERFAHFSYVPMPGSAACIKNPLRMAYGVLWAFDLLDHPAARLVFAGDGQTQAVMAHQIEKALNTPYTSSVGRLFDAASALLGICTQATYEGEPAILLEAALDKPEDGFFAFDGRYEIQIVKNAAYQTSTAHETAILLLDASGTFKALLDDMQQGIALSHIVRNFHEAFIKAVEELSLIARELLGLQEIALSGGVFMNRYLIEGVCKRLVRQGFTVAINCDLPPNDGCVSFGQAVVAYHLHRREQEH